MDCPVDTYYKNISFMFECNFFNYTFLPYHTTAS